MFGQISTFSGYCIIFEVTGHENEPQSGKRIVIVEKRQQSGEASGSASPVDVSSTNVMKSNSGYIGVIRRVQRQCAISRYVASGFLEVERGFRWIKGYKQVPSCKGEIVGVRRWATLESA